MAWKSVNTTNENDASLAGTLLVRAFTIACLWFCQPALPVSAQLGGFGGGSGGGMPGGGAPSAVQKPRFRDAIHEMDGMTINRENGDKLVAAVKIVGNRRISAHVISQKLQTRKGRFYDEDTALADISRMHQMGAFDHAEFRTEETPDGIVVTFTLHERPVIREVVFHGNRRLNDRELKGRAGVSTGDPLSPYAIESAVRRLVDYYHEEGFNRVALSSQIDEDGNVLFRINEGVKERIWEIRVLGGTIVSEGRLKNVIKSRDSRKGLTRYIGNVADLDKIDRDVEILQQYFHNLGFLTATVGRTLNYHEDGSLLDVTFVVNEGPRFKVNEIQIVGNHFVTEDSLRARLETQPGEYFDGTTMRLDVGEIIYGYGELGFIYAEVEPKPILRDENGSVDLVYEISEGDRWRIGEIHINIDGEPHLMKESTILNMMELREGDVIDRRKLESDRRRIGASPLLESDLNIAEAPDIKVVPVREYR